MKLAHIVFSTLSALAAAAHAQSTTDHSAHHPASTSTAAAMSDAEVRKVDKDQGKLTLRHGPIASLDMPSMTMVFKVADPKLLDTVKAGDKIRFTAENRNGALTVTAIDLVK